MRSPQADDQSRCPGHDAGEHEDPAGHVDGVQRAASPGDTERVRHRRERLVVPARGQRPCDDQQRHADYQPREHARRQRRDGSRPSGKSSSARPNHARDLLTHHVVDHDRCRRSRQVVDGVQVDVRVLPGDKVDAGEQARDSRRPSRSGCPEPAARRSPLTDAKVSASSRNAAPPMPAKMSSGCVARMSLGPTARQHRASAPPARRRRATSAPPLGARGHPGPHEASVPARTTTANRAGTARNQCWR